MLKLRHIGIVVRNLEKSKEFYQTLFNLELVGDKIEDGEYIEKLVGIKDGSIHWVKLKAIDGTILELLEYKNNPHNELNNYPANRLGCSHIAISVEDIVNVYEQLIKYNCKCVSSPILSPDGKVKVMYCHDIDGTILEIVQELL